MGNADLTQLGKILTRPDPLLSFKWVSQLLPFELPSHYLEGIDLPFNNVAVHEGVYSASGYTYYPGSHNVASFNATFYMDSEGTSLKWLMAWKAKVKSFETGVYELPVKYKQSWKVQLLDTTNKVIIQSELVGVWPSDTSAFSLNYTDNGRLTLQQAFSIDDQKTSFP